MGHPPREPDPPPAKPTWLLRARALESTEWQDIRVTARSLAQADAILKQQGFVVDPSAGRVLDAPADNLAVLHAAPGPLRCRACGYDLDGLAVCNAIIECPECGHGQVVLAYHAEIGDDAADQAGGHTGNFRRGVATGCLTSVLIVFLLFLLFMLLLAAQTN